MSIFSVLLLSLFTSLFFQKTLLASPKNDTKTASVETQQSSFQANLSVKIPKTHNKLFSNTLPSQTKKHPSIHQNWVKQAKILPFTDLYIDGQLHINVDKRQSEATIKIQGNPKITRHVQVHVGARKDTLSLSLLLPNLPAEHYPIITIPNQSLRRLYHRGTGQVNIDPIVGPLKLVNTGSGLLQIESINSNTVQLIGAGSSQTRLAGLIGHLDAYLEETAGLDTRRSYIQRSFIRTRNRAQVVTGVNTDLLGAQAKHHSVIRYEYDPPATGLFTYQNGYILRET